VTRSILLAVHYDSPLLPGDIPGLLQRGSPVITPVLASNLVYSLEDGYVNCIVGTFLPSEVALRLNDRTGRAHAAWWAANTATWKDTSMEEDAILDDAAWGEPMTPEQIEQLRALVMRLAGKKE